MTQYIEFYCNIIMQAYDAYHDAFKEITRRAEIRFTNEDWKGFREDAVERLGLYGDTVERTVSELIDRIGDKEDAANTWTAVKQRFSGLVADRHDHELAETFFNSVTRRVFAVMGVNPEIEFTVADFRVPRLDERLCPDCSPYAMDAGNDAGKKSVEDLIGDVFARFKDRIPVSDPGREVDRVARAVENRLTQENLPSASVRIEMADPVFYRNKIAYLVGRKNPD